MKKHLIFNFVLAAFLTCLYAVGVIEFLINVVLYDQLYDHIGSAVHYIIEDAANKGVLLRDVLGNYVVPLFCLIIIVGIVGIFICSIVRRIKKIISWKEFFMECACTVSGIILGDSLSILYFFIRIMTL